MKAALMEASSFNSPGIASGHLLLGVLREADDVLGEVLSSAGITVDAAKSHLADEASEVRTDNTARDGPLMAPPGVATRQVLKRAGALVRQGHGICDLGSLSIARALLEEQQVRPILDALSVNYDALCAELAGMRNANPYGSIEEAAKALRAAFSATMRMDRVVAPAHMLIALVSQWNDPVAKVFFQHGVTVARLQTIIRDDPSLA
jgi:ATP-dependent Clp protease ATP-binding subunit ClpA